VLTTAAKETIGPYALVRTIGRGTYATVKLAVHTTTRQQVRIACRTHTLSQALATRDTAHTCTHSLIGATGPGVWAGRDQDY
jgi:hypothetical protein